MAILPVVVDALDRLLPPDIAANKSVSIEDLTRARTLIGMLSFSTAIVAASMVVFLVLHLIGWRDFSDVLMIAGGGLAMLVAEYLFLKKVARINASAVLFSLVFFLAVVFVVFVSGGAKSPIFPLLMCPPMISFVIGGRGEGIYNSFFVMVAGLAFIVLDHTGFPLVQLINTESHHFMSAVTWLVTLFFLVSSMSVYDIMLQRLSEKLGKQFR